VAVPSLADVPIDGASPHMLGKYELIRRLATGGMAELFLARASAMAGFEKLVVLKRILPAHAESEDFIRMFLAEARLAATLHHPNIVQVYDIGEQRGTYFFTMEYVQGQDLRRIVRAARRSNRALPLEHILHIIMGIAAGLNHAHEKVGHDGLPLGIVHRDVSPSNVLVTYEGSVKIVDFGIAKAATAQTATIAGTLKGKIPYMSPEQCRGESVDRRSDIFSIGTLLWELTTGKRLFAGDNEFATLNRVAQGDVPLPSSVRPDYPPELEQIVMKALQADPDQRYSTALDLQVDLEDFAREARLPVSSARMAKFMRELFIEEMEQAARELQEDRSQVTRAEPGSTQPMVVGGAADFFPEASDELPSSNGTPTPGPGLDDSRSGIGTEVGSSFSLSTFPRKRRRGMIAASVGGVAVVGSLAAFAAFGTGSHDSAAAAAVVERVVEAPPVEPDPDETRPEAPEEPEEALVVTDEQQGEEAREPVEVVEIVEIIEPEPESDTPEPEDEDEPSKAVAKSGKTTQTRKETRRSSKPTATPKQPPPPKPTPSTKKPKWDPDAPLPPGM
jgi:serine/threonine protein kinase